MRVKTSGMGENDKGPVPSDLRCQFGTQGRRFEDFGYLLDGGLGPWHSGADHPQDLEPYS